MKHRNNKGWLTVKALLGGEREQYETEFGGATYTLQLLHEAATDDFVVKLEVRNGKDLDAVRKHFFGTEVADARHWFAKVKVRIRDKQQADTAASGSYAKVNAS